MAGQRAAVSRLQGHGYNLPLPPCRLQQVGSLLLPWVGWVTGLAEEGGLLPLHLILAKTVGTWYLWDDIPPFLCQIWLRWRSWWQRRRARGRKEEIGPKETGRAVASSLFWQQNRLPLSANSNNVMSSDAVLCSVCLLLSNRLTKSKYPEETQLNQPHWRMGREASLKQKACMLFHPPNIHPGSIWTRCGEWTLRYHSYIQIITAEFHSPHKCFIMWKQAIRWYDKYKMSAPSCTDIHCSVSINTPNLCQGKWCTCINNTWTRQLWGLPLARHLLRTPTKTSAGKEVLPEMSFKCARRSSNCCTIWGKVERVLRNMNYPNI